MTSTHFCDYVNNIYIAAVCFCVIEELLLCLERHVIINSVCVCLSVSVWP